MAKDNLFLVEYHTTCDEYNQAHSDSRQIEATDIETAEMLVLNEMEKHYPHGEVTIERTKLICEGR